jgi:dihydrofolate reductase
MRKIILQEWMSLDGVVQAPSYPDEDTSGGFPHGGWHSQYFDEMSQNWVAEDLARAGGFLFGRRTYQAFEAHWPNAGDAEQALAKPLNTKPKYVASTTLDTLGWHNSTLLLGDVTDAVRELKLANDEGNLHLIGSPALARTLLEHDLVDELHLMIDPVLLGGGKGLFPADGALRTWRLVEGRPTTTGAILATYQRA